MSEHLPGPPMDPAYPFLRVELLLAYDNKEGIHIAHSSNVPLEINWERDVIGVEHNWTNALPPGSYVFTVRHGEGFRVAGLPIVGLSEAICQVLLDYYQTFCEEKFRTLCVGLVTFPTSREIRLAARGIAYASVQTVIRSLKDPDKLQIQSNFLKLIPTAIDEFNDGGFRFPGEIFAMPGIPDDAGHLEVKVGYLDGNSINTWLNGALVECLSKVVEEVYYDVLRDVVVLFDDKRSWYGRAGARLRKLVGL